MKEVYRGHLIRENKKGFYANGDNVNFYGSTVKEVKCKIDAEMESNITYIYRN